MCKLHRGKLHIATDLALHRLPATGTSGFYGLIVERHRQACSLPSAARRTSQNHDHDADPRFAQAAMDLPPSAGAGGRGVLFTLVLLADVRQRCRRSAMESASATGQNPSPTLG
ncbi:hypothetical protein B8W66_22905 [Mycobacterium decipiens]|uniref:Uncharacterized protein n=1 Tax=Mycobacterium decipiens TaxID=1430326 RepID=A0A1X2LNU3_9MYCO|nr:hypothetical protein B8W66_22905 [Mycobacterium decipiens]